MRFQPTRVVSQKAGVRKQYVEPTGPGGSTLPIKPKRERIPAATGSLKDAPKVKKRFSQLSKDIKDLKTDIKVDRDIDKKISDVASKTRGTTGATRTTGVSFIGRMRKQTGDTLKKARKFVMPPDLGAKGPKSMKDVKLPDFVKKDPTKIKGAKGPMSMKDVKSPKFSKTDNPSFKKTRGTKPTGVGGVIRQVRQKTADVLGKAEKAVKGTGTTAGLTRGSKSIATRGGAKAVEKAALKKIGQKAVQKAGTKAATKAVTKSALKAIPGIGAFVSGAEAAGRLATGDVKGAALSAGEAIPGVGLGFAAANVARDVGRAKKAAKAIRTVSATQKLPKAMTRIPKGPMTKMPRGAKEVSLGKGMEIVKPGSGTIQKAPTGGISRKRVGQIAGGTAAYTTQKGFKGELPDLKKQGVKGGKTGFRSAKS